MLLSRRLRLCYALCVWGGGGFFGDDYLESAFVTFVRIAPPPFGWGLVSVYTSCVLGLA